MNDPESIFHRNYSSIIFGANTGNLDKLINDLKTTQKVNIKNLKTEINNELRNYNTYTVNYKKNKEYSDTYMKYLETKKDELNKSRDGEYEFKKKILIEANDKINEKFQSYEDSLEKAIAAHNFFAKSKNFKTGFLAKSNPASIPIKNISRLTKRTPNANFDTTGLNPDIAYVPDIDTLRGGKTRKHRKGSKKTSKRRHRK
jgi:hypothetical protein